MGFLFRIAKITEQITAAVDTYFNRVSLLINADNAALPFNADASSNKRLINIVGAPRNDTFSPFPGTPTAGSAYFNGTTDYLAPVSAPYIGTGQFTIECWIYKTSSAARYITSWGGAAGYFRFLAASATAITVWNGASQFLVATVGNYLNAWHHVVVQRNAANLMSIYFDGVLINSVTTADNFNLGTMQIGAENAANKFDGYISNYRYTVGEAIYSSNFTPSTVPLTAGVNTAFLTLQHPGPANNNVFVDSSVNKLPITRTGTIATQGTFTPFSNNGWSGYFAGGVHYLTMPSTVTLGTSAFTAEWWYYPTELKSGTEFIHTAEILIMYNGTTAWGRTNQGSWNGATASTTFPTLNQWNHMAVVREGTGAGQEKLYLNGVLVATGTNATNYSALTFRIGNNLAGNVSNMRVTNSAVYTAPFTPPTSNLSVITDTVMLALQDNRFVEKVTNTMLTVAGTPSVQPVSPFAPTSAWSAATNGGSIYLESSSTQYLTAPANTAFDVMGGDFTIESWVYFSSYNTMAASGSTIVTNFVNGGNGWAFTINGVNGISSVQVTAYTANATVATKTAAIPAGALSLATWNHVAAVSSGGNLYFYLNGVQLGSTQASPGAVGVGGNLTVGVYFQNLSYSGNAKWYISNLRITKGTAVYTGAFTPPTAPLTPIANTSLLLSGTNAGISDAAGKTDLVTIGAVTVSTATTKFGSGSLRFDGTTGYVYVPGTNPAFAFGTGDLTVEAWLFVPTLAALQTIFDTNLGGDTSGTGRLLIDLTTAGIVRAYTNAGTTQLAQSASGAITANAWHHFAVVRSTGVWKIYVNGTASGTTTTNAVNLITNANRPVIGANAYNLSGKFSGYIDDLRVTKGAARYTADFTPPSATFYLQ